VLGCKVFAQGRHIRNFFWDAHFFEDFGMNRPGPELQSVSLMDSLGVVHRPTVDFVLRRLTAWATPPPDATSRLAPRSSRFGIGDLGGWTGT